MALGYTSRRVEVPARPVAAATPPTWIPAFAGMTKLFPIAARLRLLLSDVYAASLHNHRLMLHRASAAAATRGRSTPASERPLAGSPLAARAATSASLSRRR